MVWFGDYDKRRALTADERAEIMDHSMALANRQARERITRENAALTPEQREANTKALMRIIYDERVGAGEIEPLPDDLTGWNIGQIVVTGPGSKPGCWAVHNANPSLGKPDTYDVSVEALMDSYARGDICPPSPGPPAVGA